MNTTPSNPYFLNPPNRTQSFGHAFTSAQHNRMNAATLNSSTQDEIQIYYQNVNGIMTKMQQLHAEILAATFPIYIFVDTNLNPTVESHEFFPNTFNIYRCDRSKKTSNKSSHGGVLIAADKQLKSEIILHGEENGCEQLWVKLTMRERNVYLGALYVSPGSNASLYEINMNMTRQLHSLVDTNDTIIFCGDFNLPQLQWERSQSTNDNIADISPILNQNSLHPVNVVGVIDENVIDTCQDIGLSQINGHLNDNNRILDLIWSNDPDDSSCNICVNHLLRNESHHKALTIDFVCGTSNSVSSDDDYYRDFRSADYNCLNNEFSMIDWDEILNIQDFEESLSKFYAIINRAIAKWVPLKKRKIYTHPKWFDKTAIALKNKMNSLHKQNKKWNSTQFSNEYSKVRKDYKQYIRKSFFNYKIKTQQQINENPNSFYNFVRDFRKKSDDFPACMSYKDKKGNSPNEIAELFRNFFESVYTKSSPDSMQRFIDNSMHIEKMRNICSIIPPIELNEEKIQRKINCLPDNMVAGPDDLPNSFIKNCSSSLLKPISNLLNRTLSSSVTPQLWKSSYVRPIFKSGSRNSVSNYRGVAVQCTIPKLLDSIVANHINNYLSDIISHHQHGFMPGKSTITNLAEYTFEVMNDMKSNLQVDAIYLDISKAFDTVDINLLCHKLELMGLNHQLLNWLRDYLAERQQIVKMNSSCKSQPINVTSGVGQGYPLGAILFKLFIVDLPFYIQKASLYLFADDAKLMMPVNTIDDCVQLQLEIDNASEYFGNNMLSPNAQKTKSITFKRRQSSISFVYSIDGANIQQVQKITDLGVILDDKMTFKYQIDHVISRAKSIMAWIKRFAYQFDDPWVIKKLYMTYVLPVLEYGSQIWSPQFQNQRDRIESIQKQFLLYAFRLFKWPHRYQLPSYRHRLLLLQMNTLGDRRIIAQICFIFQLLKGNINSIQLLSKIERRVYQRDLRNYELLVINYNNHEPFNIMQQKFNEYSNVIDLSKSVESLKNNLKQMFKIQL